MFPTRFESSFGSFPLVWSVVSLVQQFCFSSCEYNLIVNVRDVYLVQYFVVEVALQDPTDYVKGQYGPGVAHVRRVVNSGTTDVHSH